MIKNINILRRGDVIVNRDGDRSTFLGFYTYKGERIAIVEDDFVGMSSLSIDYISKNMFLIDDIEIDFATLERGTKLQFKEDGEHATFIAYVEDVDDTCGVIVLTEGILEKYSPSEFTLPEKRLIERWINVSEYQDDEGDYEIGWGRAIVNKDNLVSCSPGYRWVKVSFEE